MRDSKKKKTERDTPSEPKVPINIAYQSWYSKALPVVKQLLPERYTEFQEQYRLEKRKEVNYLTYTISDYLIRLKVTRTRGVVTEDVVDSLGVFVVKLQQQLSILKSAIVRIDSILSDIEGVLNSSLFKHELEAAWDLQKKGHLRAAGALAGVTLETHLSKVASNHQVKLRKRSPTISDFNEELKKQNVIDVPTWRLIQRLGDIRNLSVHANDREPTSDEISDLIVGVEKLIAALS